MENTMTTPAAAANAKTVEKPVLKVEKWHGDLTKSTSAYACNLYHNGELLLTSGYRFPNMGIAANEAGTLIHMVDNPFYVLKGERHSHGYRLSLRNTSHQEIASNGDWSDRDNLHKYESLIYTAFYLIRTSGVTIDINP